jgi:hypothetical protein
MGQALKKTQTTYASASSRYDEFDYLKITALFLLIFVHSDLIIAFPNIFYPVEWFLLSAFFFVGGFLAFDTFHRRGESIRGFFKPKALSLYIPFMGAAVTYFFLEVASGYNAGLIALVSQVSMADIFNSLNTLYNWGFLWFIPYLLAFMLIVCLLEKYVKTMKLQLFIVSVLWLSTILLWVYNTPMRLGQLFSEFLLVFVVGFWVNKLKIYTKIISFKMAYFAVPSVALFAFNFSSLFNYGNAVSAFMAYTYSFSRIIIFSLALVLLTLLFLRKTKVKQNSFIKLIASKSAYIYLAEPLISYAILRLVIGQPDIFVANGADFYIYLITRIVVLLVLLPLGFMAGTKLYQKRASAKLTVGRALATIGSFR